MLGNWQYISIFSTNYPFIMTCIFQGRTFDYDSVNHTNFLLIMLNQMSCIFQYIAHCTLRSQPWLGKMLRNICVTNDHGYVPLVVSTFRSFPHSWLIIRFVTRVTRRVSLVGQKFLTLPEHLSSLAIFIGFWCWTIFSFLCSVL